MIKVIKHGKIRKCECHKCECVFTFEKDDIKNSNLGRNEYYDYVKCPDCGEDIEIK